MAEPVPNAATRPYQLQEIQGLKNSELTELVVRELDKWPHKPRTSNGVHRAKKEDLITALLSNGFTTTNPLPILTESSETSFRLDELGGPNLGTTPSTFHPPPPLPGFQLPEYGLSDGTVSEFRIHVQGIRPTDVHTTQIDPRLIPVPSPTPAPVPVPVPVPERRNLQVFVMDQRRLEDALYQPQTAEVVVEVHTDSQTPDTLRFYARDLVRALQATNARLDGGDPVSIGHQHSAEMRGFFITFAKEVVPDDCSSYTFTPETLRFPRDGNLIVTVNLPHRPVLRADSPAATACSSQESMPSTPSPSESPKGAARKGLRRDPAVVNYLREKLLEYDNLGERVRKNKGITLHNSDIVDEWERVITFYDTFIGSRFPELSGKKITKADLVAAFECSSSWLDNAKEGHEKIKLYGKEGTQPSSDVIMKIEDKPVTGPEGKGKLLEFLRKYRPAP
ncbi:hypothetical protein PQX77_002483 [Marasmius sp. AFHP31]|nr:hypothetical protein PQX77_003150 [Marasmius sp. AFHP31]KAK1234316.1 hypothetical protein PQX77_002483 [Marasmius sp. AFHP31]